MTRWIAIGALAAVLVVAAVLALTGRGDEHSLTVDVPSAPGVIPGLAVRAAGQRVGTVEDATVTPQHTARLRLSLDDDVWPLPVDSRLQLRVGGAIKYTDRYIDVVRGHDRRTIADDGRLPAGDFVAPTDIDQLLFTFDRSTRRGLRRLLENGGAAFGDASADLNAALAAAPPAVAQARAVVDDLGGDPDTLASLVRSSDRVTAAVVAAQPDLDGLLRGAAQTFETVAGEAGSVRDTLAAAPAMMDQARTTLAHADRTLTAAGTLTERLAPGVEQVRRLATPLDGTLERLVQVGPDARGTVTTLGNAAPDLNRFLDTLQPLLGRFQRIGTGGATALECIRPYSPEIAGLFTTWGTGIWANRDSQDHYVRAEVGTYPFTNASPLSSEQLTKLLPGLSVSFPRPPGDAAGQPWYQPQCDIGPSSQGAADDPENGATSMYPANFFADHANPDPDAGK